MMKVTVWTVVTDGDDLGTECEVFATEAEAIAYISDRLDEPFFTSAGAEDAWTAAADGMCSIGSHEIEVR